LGTAAEFKATPTALFLLETPLDITWSCVRNHGMDRGCVSDDTDQAVFIMIFAFIEILGIMKSIILAIHLFLVDIKIL